MNDPRISGFLESLQIPSLNEMQLDLLGKFGQHESIILLSPTGSGKTLAFLVPLALSLDQGLATTQALIIVPTRELALQTESVFRKMKTGLTICACYGGHKKETEENALRNNPHIVIGTPGRLADHLRGSVLNTKAIHTVITDEFDKCLEMGFSDEMSFILNRLSALKKRILTSATDIDDLPSYAGAKNAHRIIFLKEQSKDALDLRVLKTSENDKLDALRSIIFQTGGERALVFCNHRESVDRVSDFLWREGVANEAYHGGMEQKDREKSLVKFRNGSVWVLVTTDLGARGLDIPETNFVVHYHLPLNEDAFIHRNGRTARMHASGTAVLILAPNEEIPDFIPTGLKDFKLAENPPALPKPLFSTLWISAGKKDKISKGDVMGFVSHTGGVQRNDVGLIEVKDTFSFVAVAKTHAAAIQEKLNGEKIKNKKVKTGLVD